MEGPPQEDSQIEGEIILDQSQESPQSTTWNFESISNSPFADAIRWSFAGPDQELIAKGLKENGIKLGDIREDAIPDWEVQNVLSALSGYSEVSETEKANLVKVLSDKIKGRSSLRGN